MGYHDVMKRMADEHALMSVLLELTYRCNLDCFFCYNDLNLEGERLSTNNYLQLLEDLRNLQVMVLVLSGGEPLTSPAFWPLGRRARELGFVTRVKSNGHAVGKDVARRLKKEVDPYVVEVSLHGACAETHDRQTRVEGSFDKLTANLEEMRRAGLRVKLNSTLTQWNEKQIAEMFALADDLDIPLSMDAVVTPRDDGDREPLAIAASAEGVAHLYSLLRERKGHPPQEILSGWHEWTEKLRYRLRDARGRSLWKRVPVHSVAQAGWESTPTFDRGDLGRIQSAR